MSGFAPQRADGLKPWAVVRREPGGGRSAWLVYAKTSSLAEREIVSRDRHCTARARRARVNDLGLPEYPS